MHLERLTDGDHPLYQKAMALYRISFPVHEQREAPSQAAILTDDEYRFQLICDEGRFVGVILCWETERFIYVEHFCILPEMRSRGYGRQALALLTECQKPVVLEIDPPVDEVAVRRKGFYERCGFAANPYAHVHPPYHRGSSGHPLVIMSCPGEISQAEYYDFKRYLDHRVMKNAF